MDTPRCLDLARRIDLLLQVELGTGIDRRRMLSDALYARDVLLVCDAHRGHALAELARDYRAAAAAAAATPGEVSARTPAPDPTPPEPPPPSGRGGSSSRVMSSLLDAFRSSRLLSTLPPDDPDPPPPGPRPRTPPWYSPSRWRR